MSMELREIIQRQEQLFEEGNASLVRACQTIKHSGKQIVIFGAGQAGRLMKQQFDAERIPVAAFTDNNPTRWGETIAGVPVIPPTDVPTDASMVVISAWDSDRIAEQLRQLGVAFVDKDLYVSIMVLPQREYYRAHLEQALKMETLLVDEASKNVLRALILHALTLDRRYLTSIHQQDQYFFDPQFAVQPGETVIDAGAFVGDTVEEIVKRYGTDFKRIHCFEPNERNYRTLTAFLEANGLTEKVIPHPVGLWDANGTLHASGSGSSFHASAPGEQVSESINTITLDACMQDEKVDFIKMDLEGAEQFSLRGAERCIVRDKPRLAICVYHLPEQLWEIPFQIQAMEPRYRFRLRNHTAQRRETVLYASVEDSV